jgi:hypothetical protein
MGINDVTRARYPFPRDLQQRLYDGYYGAVLFDQVPQGHYHQLLRSHKLARYYLPHEAPSVVTGYIVRPRYLFVRKTAPDPPPAGTRLVFDFESGTYQGWTVTGSAFGQRPSGGNNTSQGMAGPYQGAYLASSAAYGDRAVGRLISQPFRLDKPILRYRIGGGRDQKSIYISLRSGGQEIYRGTGINTHVMEQRRVDLRPHLGKMVQIELADNAQGSWGHILFDEVLLSER